MKPLETDRSDAAETIASLERERALLEGEVRALRVALAARGKEHSQLSWQLAEVMDANNRLEAEVESREVKR